MYQPTMPGGEAQGKIVSHRPIGSVLVDLGKLSAVDSAKVLDYQQKGSLLFGEAAVKLKLVTSTDIEHALAEQFSFPFVDTNTTSLSKDLVIVHKPFSVQAEAIRNIRTQLLLSGSVDSDPCISITSAQRGDGRSYFAANLAVALAQLGKKTLLIDMDLRRPRQCQIFNIPNKYGLSMLLKGSQNESIVLQMEGIPMLSVLPAGPTPPNPLELLSSDRMEKLIAEYRRNYDYIVLDTAAGSEHSDAELISKMAGTAVVLVRQNNTKFDLAKEHTDKIRNLNIKIAGCVVNEF